jgi:hypothetical protein
MKKNKNKHEVWLFLIIGCFLLIPALVFCSLDRGLLSGKFPSSSKNIKLLSFDSFNLISERAVAKEVEDSTFANSSYIHVTWGPLKGATQYKVYREQYQKKCGSNQPLGQTLVTTNIQAGMWCAFGEFVLSSTENYFNDDSTELAGRYRYSVLKYTNSGNYMTDYSDYVIGGIAPPASLDVVFLEPYTVRVEWSEALTPINGYNLRIYSGNTNLLNQNFATSVNEYLFNGFGYLGHDLRFEVRGNYLNDTTYAASVDGIILVAPPENISISSSGYQVSLSWDEPLNPNGIVGYEVLNYPFMTEDNLWIATDAGISKFDGNDWILYDSSNSAIHNQIKTDIAEDLDGNIWFASNSGIEKFDGATWTLYDSSNSPLQTDLIQVIAFDNNGTMWLGTYSSGIIIYDGINWVNLNPTNSPLSNGTIRSIKFDSLGKAWISTHAGLNKFDGTNWEVFNTSNSGIAHNVIYDSQEDSNGDIWVLAPSGNGISVYDGASWDIIDTNNSGLSSNTVLTIERDSNGRMLIGTNIGLDIYDGATWENYNNSNAFFGGNQNSSAVRNIVQKNNGDLVVSTPQAIHLFDGSNWTNYYTSNSGLPNDFIRSVHFQKQSISLALTTTTNTNLVSLSVPSLGYEYFYRVKSVGANSYSELKPQGLPVSIVP